MLFKKSSYEFHKHSNDGSNKFSNLFVIVWFIL